MPEMRERVGAAGIIATLLLALLIPLDALAQAWTQPAGHAYLKVAHGRTSVSDQYTVTGDVAPFTEDVEGDAFFDRSIYLYGEVGLLPGLTLVSMLPVKNISVEQDSARLQTVGLGDIEIRARIDLRPLLGPLDESTAIALSMGTRLPSGYTRNLSPSVGAGQTNLQVGLSLGHAFHPVPIYMQGNVTFVNRLSMYGLSRAIECTTDTDIPCSEDIQPDFDDEWIYRFETGISIGSSVLVQALAEGKRSLNKPDEQFEALNPIPTRSRFLKLGSGVTVSPTESIGLSVQLFRTVAGRNTLRSTEIFLGVEYKIKGL